MKREEASSEANAPAALVLLLACLTSIGPFSVSTYQPSFPAIASALGVGVVAVQQTLTAYLLPFTLMTLWHGALADALGRRRVILVFIGGYGFASLLAASATGIEQLLVARALQGITSGAGIIVGRAIIRDCFEGTAAQRLMAKVTMLFALAPAIAPMVGGWLQVGLGWRAIFVFLAAFAALLCAAIALYLPETLPKERRQPLHPAYLWRAYLRILGDGRFVALTLAVGLGFAGLFIYVLSAPVFLMRHLHVGETGFAWLFAPAVGGMMLGSWLSSRLAGRWSPRLTVQRGFTIMAVAAGANLCLNLWLPPQLPWAVAPLFVYTLGNALSMPNLTLMALDLHPDRRGMASSCQSFIQAGISTLGAGLLAPLLWVSALRLAAGQCVLLGLAAICAFLAISGRSPLRQRGEEPNNE